MTTARDEAAEILLRIDRSGGRVKDALGKARARLADPRERGLLTELAYGVVRRRSTLDALIAKFSKRPVPKLHPALRTALRLSAYQLVFLDRVPDHALVDHAVRWASKHAGARRAGYVNGVIRNLARAITGPATPPEQPRCDVPRSDGSAIRLDRKVFLNATTSLAGHLGARYAMPQWMVERWISAWGEAQVREILVAGIARPPLTLRARIDRDALVARLAAEGVTAEAGAGPFALRMPDGEAALQLVLTSGDAAVQDASSQRVVPLLAPQPGEDVLDLCAAPGGKSLHIADVMKTGHLVACDIEPHKVQGLATLTPLMGEVRYDVVPLEPDAALPFPPASFDAILVDAPCTNTGVLARRVEARWRARITDAPALATLQGTLLDRAVAVLRPGGRIVYSTCSIETVENEEVIAAFLARHPAFEQVDGYRTWPSPDGDGGFAALLRRRS